jgi:hypothetical protein
MRMISRRQLGTMLLVVGPVVMTAACVDDTESPKPTVPDSGTSCGPGQCVDASIPEAAPEASATDAPAEAIADAGHDGGVIVGCVPQEVSTRYDATWIFGNGCRADWSASNVVTFSSTRVTDGGPDAGSFVLTGFEGTIVAADAKSGALFAASDGIDLYDGNGTKTNTVPLGGNASTSQAVAFIGKPGSTSDFYIVTNAASSGQTTTAGLFVSELPCGKLVPTAAPALIAGTDQLTEALATVRHANDVDRWALSASSTGIAVIPVTAAGFGAPVITPWGAELTGVLAMQRAFIVLARDRHTFALTAENAGVIVGQFDNATGAVSHITRVPMPLITYLYSAAFSPDGTKLYVSSYSGQYGQVDLTALAAVPDGGDAGSAFNVIGSAGGALRLAIDDRLYIAQYGTATLTAVTNPNAPAAQLQTITVNLPAGCTSSYGLPGIGDL